MSLRKKWFKQEGGDCEAPMVPELAAALARFAAEQSTVPVPRQRTPHALWSIAGSLAVHAMMAAAMLSPVVQLPVTTQESTMEFFWLTPFFRMDDGAMGAEPVKLILPPSPDAVLPDSAGKEIQSDPTVRLPSLPPERAAAAKPSETAPADAVLMAAVTKQQDALAKAVAHDGIRTPSPALEKKNGRKDETLSARTALLKAEQERLKREQAAVEQAMRENRFRDEAARAAELERLAVEKAALERNRLEQLRLENLAREAAEREQSALAAAKSRAEQDRLAQEKERLEKLAREKREREQARLAALARQVEVERQARAKAELDRLLREKVRLEKLAQESAALEQKAREAAARRAEENARIAMEKSLQEKLARERSEQERARLERTRQERAAKESAERDRKAREERMAHERILQEKLSAEKAERERRTGEETRLKAEHARLAREQSEREKAGREAAEAAGRAELARLGREQHERIRAAAERVRLEQAASLQAKKHAEEAKKTLPAEPKGIPVPVVNGDLKLAISGDSRLGLEVRFRPFPKSRRSRPLTRSESKRDSQIVPVMVNKGGNVREAVIEQAREGIYTFFVVPEKAGQSGSFVLTLYETSSRKSAKKLGKKTVAERSVLTRVLMPEGILWEEDAAFTGSMEDSDGITKFNSETGLLWKEYPE